MGKKETREIVRINEELCDGCGICVPACAEGAIQIIDGKAKLVSESFCDGLGACLGDCPQGAINIEVREADPFDEEAVEEYIRSKQESLESNCTSCPSSREMLLEKETENKENEREEDKPEGYSSELNHWPVQLKLIPPDAKFLKQSHLLIAADCVPFAFADFHKRFLKGKALLIGCPKLDDATLYYQKLTDIFKINKPEKVTVLIMEVPCCSGLSQLVARALEEAGNGTALETIVIGINGEVKDVS